MAKRFGLTVQCIEDITNVFKLHPEIEEAVMFGSRAMGTYKKGSDIDISLKGSKVNFNVIGTIKAQLDELPYAYTYDIVNYHKISNKSVVAHIDELGISFYEPEEELTEWKTHRLEEIASVQTGPFGSQLHQADYVEVGTPIITVEHLGENRIIHTNVPRVTDEDKQRLSKYWLQEGDIVFSRVGSVDRRAYVKKDEEGWLFSGRCLRVRPNKKEDGKYLSYYFGLEEFKRKIRGVAVGATMPSLNTSIMNDIEVLLPNDKSAKIQIASILSSVDDKIELDLQMNQTLEAMAQAIFKEWFVNFNFPGFDGKLVDGLPKGWSEINIGDLFQNTIGGDWGKDEYSEEFSEKVYVVRGTDFENILSGNISKVPIRYIKKSNLEKKRIRYGNILLEISGGSKDQPTGRTILFTDELLSQFNLHVVPASFCRLIKAKDTYAAFFLNTFFNHFYKIGGTWEYQNQSTGISNFQFTYFAENKRLAFPNNPNLLKQFGELVSSIVKKQHENILQVKSLAQTRDNLLPRLMTGKIEIN